MVAPGLRITAVSPDGCVEGIESEDGLLHGIQWHPEKMHAEGAAVPMLGVFEQLVARSPRAPALRCGRFYPIQAWQMLRA